MRTHRGPQPDPKTAADQAEFRAMLRELQQWAGYSSLEQLEKGATRRGVTMPPSTANRALNNDKLPTAEFVRRFVAACDADVNGWLSVRDMLHDQNYLRDSTNIPSPREEIRVESEPSEKPDNPSSDDKTSRSAWQRYRLGVVSIVIALGLVGFAVFQYGLSDRGLTFSYVKSFGSSGADDGQLNDPTGLAVSSSNAVYVSEYGNDRVQIFNTEGRFRISFGVAGSAPGEFKKPRGVTVAPDKTFYVADYENDRVQRFTPEGRDVLGVIGTSGSGQGELNGPRGVAVNSAGHIYVADSQNHRVQYFSPDGKWVGSFGSQGSANGQFINPKSIALAPDGTVYVSDTGNNRVQYFNPTGAYLGQFGSFGAGDAQFNEPYGVTVGPDGHIYVADSKNSRIQVFANHGEFISSFGAAGGDDGQFNIPRAIGFGSDNRVYVVDAGNDRVQIWQRE